MKRIFSTIVTGTLGILLGIPFAWAQEPTNSGKIKLEITREINGEKKTFTGEYENEEQMKADPNYKEFMGEEDDFVFQFNHPDEDVMMNIQRLKGKNGFSFSFDDADMELFEFDPADMEELSEHMKQIQKRFEDFQFDMDANGLKWFFADSTTGAFGHSFGNVNRPNDPNNRQREVIILRKVEIKELEGEEFGKKGKVKDSEKLSLESLDYYPNPSNGKFKLRFKVPQQGELTVKVYDLSGKEVFARYFDQFGGFFSEGIDLSGQESGMYLLEVQLDKQRLTRKIVIE